VTPAVELERDGAVAVITVSNPTVRNALTLDMAAQLTAACEEVDADPSIGGVVVRGAGGTFCSGADTRTWVSTYADGSSDQAYAETDLMYNSFVRVGQLRVPTIAAVRGAAVGAGFNLALATDLRLVAKEARLLAGFLRAGIHPGGGFFTIARRVAGREATAAMGLFSEEVSGDRAVELGLAWEAVPDSDVEGRAVELASRVARDPLLARRVVRSFRLETDGAPLPWATALEVERGVQLWTQNRRLRSLAQDAGQDPGPAALDGAR
jgi:enoyl-CoA hydratase